MSILGTMLIVGKANVEGGRSGRGQSEQDVSIGRRPDPNTRAPHGPRAAAPFAFESRRLLASLPPPHL